MKTLIMRDNSRIRLRHLSTRHVPEELCRNPFGRSVMKKIGWRPDTLSNWKHRAAGVVGHSGSISSWIRCWDRHPRMLAPLDRETIFNSVINTGRLVIAASGWKLFRASALHKVWLIASAEPWGHLPKPNGKGIRCNSLALRISDFNGSNHC